MKSILVLGMPGAGEWVTIFVFFAFCIGIFLLCRAILLWYWKIDVMLNNQLKQISLLHDIVIELKKGKEKGSGTNSLT